MREKKIKIQARRNGDAVQVRGRRLQQLLNKFARSSWVIDEHTHLNDNTTNIMTHAMARKAHCQDRFSFKLTMDCQRSIMNTVWFLMNTCGITVCSARDMYYSGNRIWEYAPVIFTVCVHTPVENDSTDDVLFTTIFDFVNKPLDAFRGVMFVFPYVTPTDIRFYENLSTVHMQQPAMIVSILPLSKYFWKGYTLMYEGPVKFSSTFPPVWEYRCQIWVHDNRTCVPIERNNVFSFWRVEDDSRIFVDGVRVHPKAVLSRTEKWFTIIRSYPVIQRNHILERQIALPNSAFLAVEISLTTAPMVHFVDPEKFFDVDLLESRPGPFWFFGIDRRKKDAVADKNFLQMCEDALNFEHVRIQTVRKKGEQSYLYNNKLVTARDVWLELCKIQAIFEYK